MTGDRCQRTPCVFEVNKGSIESPTVYDVSGWVRVYSYGHRLGAMESARTQVSWPVCNLTKLRCIRNLRAVESGRSLRLSAKGDALARFSMDKYETCREMA